MSLKVVSINADPKDSAYDALGELKALIDDGTITELAIVGANLRGEVTTLYTPMGRPFDIIGGLTALHVALAARHIAVVRKEMSED